MFIIICIIIFMLNLVANVFVISNKKYLKFGEILFNSSIICN